MKFFYVHGTGYRVHPRRLSASHIFSRFRYAKFHSIYELLCICEYVDQLSRFHQTSHMRLCTTVCTRRHKPNRINDETHVYFFELFHVRLEWKTHGICTSNPHKLSFINFIKFDTHTYT